MNRVSFTAMGTGIDAWCDRADGATEVRAWFEDVESVCSRFRPDSELTRVNEAQIGTVVLSDMLTEVMCAADRARSISDGLVDVGVGAGVIEWGYDRSFEEVGDLDTTPQHIARPAWSIEGRQLARHSGTSIDLGGVAKGWACDRAVERGMARVISAGGDIRSEDSRTVVSVLDPRDLEIAARLHLGVGALATSSTTHRRWKAGGREVCHIIDPRTMEPVSSPVLSATVVAESAVDAEAGAKTAVLMGADALAWADQASWIRGAMVVWHDGSVYATNGIEVAA
jgi:thiamine biosynthesis lipoprotein